jgi:hypothetical protein
LKEAISTVIPKRIGLAVLLTAAVTAGPTYLAGASDGIGAGGTVEQADPVAIHSPAAVFAEADRVLLRLDGNSKPNTEVFRNAYIGYQHLLGEGALANTRYLTVVDFSLPSTEKRMWVIDLVEDRVAFHTFTAHGVNSGALYADDFSNRSGSFQSSLGFYVAAETYTGKHGLSLKLDGMEPGFNDKARDRAVVLHGADYATADFVRRNGRLGRSRGCPAVPREVSTQIANTISGGSCLFIYHPSGHYLNRSRLLRLPSQAT